MAKIIEKELVNLYIHAVSFFYITECIVYFLNTVHCYNSLEEYCYYEVQLHKALCDFAVQKGYCCLKEGSPPQHIYKGIFCFETIKDL